MGRQTILQKITDYILTGGRRTTAVNTRDVLNEMANTYMSVIHDTAANFAASNPILETKQIGVASDSLLSSPQYKIGDGINHWNDLPYSSGGGGIPNLQQVTDTGSTTTNEVDFKGAVDGFYKVRIGTDGSDNGSVQVYDNANNSIIELLGTRGFKVFNNANSVALFEVIRNDGVDTDKVVINASKIKLTQGTALKLLRLNANNELVSSSIDESQISTYQNITITSSATPTINVGTYRDTFVSITALATNITSFVITGSPVNGNKLWIRYKDNGTARAVSHSASGGGMSIIARGAPLLTTTVLSKVSNEGFSWNEVTSTWDCVASITEI